MFFGHNLQDSTNKGIIFNSAITVTKTPLVKLKTVSGIPKFLFAPVTSNI